MSKSINPVGTMPLAEADEKLKFIQKMLFENQTGRCMNSFDPHFLHRNCP